MKRVFSLLVYAGDPKRLWQRYLAAAIVILALLATTHAASVISIEMSAKNAALINLSGRQRMLSQRILSLSFQTATDYSAELDDALSGSIALIRSSQARLGNHEQLSDDLHSLYFGSPSLTARVNEFAELAQSVSDERGNQRNLVALNKFDHETLLKDLDLAVSGFQDIATADAKHLKTIQNISFYAAIIILIFEAVLIFVPAQLIVSRSIDRLQRQSRSLPRAKADAQERNRQLESLQKKIEYEVAHDALTGLPNRRALQTAMTERKSFAEERDSSISVMHIDLDRFKQINDTLGHDAGDHVLRSVATILRECIRSGDTVARVGGDEFVVLPMVNSTREDLEALADRIISAMRQPISYKDEICQFGASIGICIGICSHEANSVDPSELLVKADIALYRAKELGRGRYEFFTDELAEAVAQTKKTSDELITAFDKRQFTIHYQPIVCARTGEISSLEALARWQHPIEGLKTAASFIKQVDRLGLSAELDAIVFDLVARDISAACSEGLVVPPIAINVSAASLMSDDLMDCIKSSTLVSHGLSLEISETVDFDEDIEAIKQRLAEIRSYGIGIEIDDFGTGHASIFSFQKLEPHKVKIARELLLDVETSQQTRQMVQGICRLAKSLGAEVVAEGAETATCTTILQTLGCDYIQGYSLGKPKSLTGIDLGALLIPHETQVLSQVS